jgi:hypothetical protein
MPIYMPAANGITRVYNTNAYISHKVIYIIIFNSTKIHLIIGLKINISNECYDCSYILNNKYNKTQ